jgi:hypothetical protein
MAKAEKGKDEDESFVSGLFGKWNLYTGTRSTSHHTMRDSEKCQADGRINVQPWQSKKLVPRLPRVDA